MTGPLVSCIMGTTGRLPFVGQAIRCFERQTYPHRELVVVDDGPEPAEPLIPRHRGVRYVRLARRTPLGTKLNAGIEAATGTLIQKLDDDDYYHPQFLSRMVAAIPPRDTACIAALDCFLVLIGATGHLTFSGHGWCAGNSLCFPRKLWESAPFRAESRAVDWWFLKDHPVPRVKLCEPTLSVVVRHDQGHRWTRMGQTGVTDYFARRPPFARPLRALVSAEDLAFYDSLRAAARPGPVPAPWPGEKTG